MLSRAWSVVRGPSDARVSSASNGSSDLRKDSRKSHTSFVVRIWIIILSCGSSSKSLVAIKFLDEIESRLSSTSSSQCPIFQ